ncbi:MAG: YraN family protein [Cellvibrionaceae bacterium]
MPKRPTNSAPNATNTVASDVKQGPKPATASTKSIRSRLTQALFSKPAATPAMITGQKNERLAEQYLLRRGLKLKERNYHCRRGEIDLVMIDQEVLVFVEVRYRKQAKYGSPFESVDHRKQQKLIKAAQYYLQKNFPRHEPPCRFDVVAIEGNQTPKTSQNPIEWLPNAFTA